MYETKAAAAFRVRFTKNQKIYHNRSKAVVHYFSPVLVHQCPQFDRDDMLRVEYIKQQKMI